MLTSQQEGDVRVGDFGCAVVEPESSNQSWVFRHHTGTPAFQAPEARHQKEVLSKFNPYLADVSAPHRVAAELRGLVYRYSAQVTGHF